MKWIVFALLLAAPVAGAELTLVNASGQYLPELPVQVELGLGPLLEQVDGPVTLTVDSVEATNLRDRNIVPFPFGPLQVMPRGYVNDQCTVMVQGKVTYGGKTRRFLGRAAAWQDYEGYFAQMNARRPFAGFIAGPGRLDPNGPLVAGALKNAFAADGLDRWLVSPSTAR